MIAYPCHRIGSHPEARLNKHRTEQPRAAGPLPLSGTGSEGGGTPPVKRSRVRCYGLT
ncbi:hypothetical protein WJ0W_002220 [Paenibacillus melissococcoides]|uniref:Uncharacterized protein n=1 Tax=Paenibacillus melissococcoides TaxID=2912268 RepID=A0ABN8U6C8_9BACL|nr:hypothetical protein WJ0W_002220 [Paenibacillus melissococcoides]